MLENEHGHRTQAAVTAYRVDDRLALLGAAPPHGEEVPVWRARRVHPRVFPTRTSSIWPKKLEIKGYDVFVP